MNRRAFLEQLSRALAGVAVVATIPPVLASRLSWPYPLPDLREYGDGKRDATEAIHRHLDAAARDSGVVVLPEGTFRMRPLKSVRGVHMRGGSGLSWTTV